MLFAVSRAAQRADIGIQGGPPFSGVDIWTAYELSWLNPKGKPVIAMATLVIPAETPSLIESKSLKLYLNSYNGTRVDGAGEVRRRLERDLGSTTGGRVEVRLALQREFVRESIEEFEGERLDDLDVEVGEEGVNPEHLSAHGGVVEETLATDLFKANCPVTGQPDWASIQVRYRGRRLDHPGLLKYLVSYRRHEGFHEQCVERIFVDLLERCRPEGLTVYGRFTRRGGIDINPFRTNCGMKPPANRRTPRQ